LNPLDIIIGGIIAYGLYLGANKGIMKGLSNIVTIGASILCAWRFRPAVEAFMTEYESLRFGLQGQSLVFASFIATFVLAFLVVSSIMGYARKVFDALPMGLNLDKALGAVVGGFVATFALSIFLLITSSVGFPSAGNASGSLLYPPVRDFGRAVIGYVPSAMSAAGNEMKKYAPVQGTDNNGGTPSQNSRPKAIR